MQDIIYYVNYFTRKNIIDVGIKWKTAFRN